MPELTPVLDDFLAFVASRPDVARIDHSDECDRLSAGWRCIGGCLVVPAIDFDGWVIRDPEGEYLRVVRLDGDLPVIACETCGEPSSYRVVVPDGGACGSCGPCLARDLDDPRSPSEFFAPAAKR